MILGAPEPAGGSPRASQPAVGPEAETKPFFERILPPAGPGYYISLHSPFHKPGDEKPSYPGRGFDSAESAAAHVHKWTWIRKKNNQPYEQHYHCVGIIGKADPRQDGKGNVWLSTRRRQENVPLIKTMFVDIDVKPGAFASQRDALVAMAALVKANDIPSPTIVVNSGNGLHVYWTLNRAIMPGEWQPMAEGFGRFLQSKGIYLDPLYANYACLLRPPGAWNTKDPKNPKQVHVLGKMAAHDYDPSTFRRFEAYRDVVPLGANKIPARPGAMSTTGTGQGSLAAAAGNGPGGAQAAGGEMVSLLPRLPAIMPSELSAGVPEAAAQPVSMEVATARCAVLRDVLARGGNGDPEPFWRLNLLAASFDSEGRAWAHRLSNGDPRYAKDATDVKFDTIIQQRHQAGGKVGWPLCSSFAKHSAQCQTCPYQGRIKSPFNVAADDSDLPKGYSRKNGVIWKDVADTGKDDEPIPAIAFPYGLRDAYLESSVDGLTLNAELVMVHDRPRRIRVPVAAVNTWRDKIHALFGQYGIAITKTGNHLAQEFFVSFIQHLQAAAAAGTKRDAVGWTKSRDGSTGFAYGGKCWLPNGGFENTSGIDPVLESRYGRRGDMAPWKAAADFVTGMKRIDLQAILASAFAGPLVRFTGQTGLLVSAYSPKSGVQKSTAMQVAQSVWGHSVTAMNRVDDTAYSVTHKLGTLRHLPLFWDELQTDQYEAFSRLVFTLTQGSEKSRLTSDIQQRASGTWATMLMSAGNFSVQDMMGRGAKNTTAGLNRVYEFLVEPAPAGSLTSIANASSIVAACQENFGHAGEHYARALARDEKLIEARLRRISNDFESAVNGTAEERFWIFSAATLMLGAVIAKTEGLVDFDLPALRVFLIANIRGQRVAKTAATYDVTSAEYAANTLARYIQHCRRRNAYLETNLLNVPRNGIGLVEVKMTEEARRSLRAPVFHLARDVGAARWLKQEFHSWLNEEGIPARAVIDGLTKHGGLISARASWAAGTEYSLARAPVYEISLTGGAAPTDAVGNYFGFGIIPAPQVQAAVQAIHNKGKNP